MRIVTCLLLLIFAGAATASNVADPDDAWKNYLRNDTRLNPSFQFPFASCFRAAASQYELPETLLLAVARGESDFEATARSRANAHGVMQIQWPGTARHLGIYRLSDLYDPCTNIDAGAKYLREMVTRYEGNLHLALAAYNYGPGRIDIGDTNIPEGAEWYSGYIFRHLGYVLGDGSNGEMITDTLYSELGRTTLLTFGEPYRAAAFVDGMEQRAPGLQLDWFRKGVGRFVVVVMYADKDQFNKSATQLSRVGFPLN